MEFTNTTGATARLLSTTFGPDHMQAAVIARPVFRIQGEQLVEAPDLAWPIDTMPTPTAYGPFPGDLPFLTGGIDLFVFGSAWQAESKPGTRLTMDIRVGENFHRRLAVIGDRYWVGQGNGLVPSDPAPFIDMPLTYANAYGGSVDTEQGMANWPANPNGKGFYLTAEQAVGGPLPNIEDPGHLIGSFEDRPEPIATAPYPAEGSLRALNAVDLDLTPGKFGIRRIKPTLFNHAHPAMMLPPGSARPGDTVEITHASPEASLRFALPALPLEAHVELEDRAYDFPLHIDQIGILTMERRVFLSYRTVFKYRLVRRERRRTTLRLKLSGEEPDA
jgi:hypothetical protein